MIVRQDRRAFLAGTAAAAAIAAVGCRPGRGKSSSGKPNILFLMADDLGYADIGVYGGRIATPNVDSLARDGMMFTQGYANSSVCSPTRTALATGMYQDRFEVGLDEPLPFNAPEELGLPANQVTIASVLRDEGYYTALIGKWHLGQPPLHGPLQHGYDYFFGFPKGGMDYFRHREDFSATIRGDSLYLGNEPIERVGYLTELLADEAIEIIRTRPEHKPYLISLHFNAPHWPWEGPEDQSVADALTSVFHTDGGSPATYAAMVASMDLAIGRVLKALADEGDADNTIVVFTSDNGGERFSDTWPLVGNKGELLEGGIRVPLLFRWPARIAPGRSTAQIMTSMDFVPSFLAAQGGDPGKYAFDGADLSAVISSAAPERERTLFWRMHAHEQAAVRSGEWKYLRLGEQEHLFNVVDDPRERAEQRNRYPEKFDELKEQFASWNSQMLPYREGDYMLEPTRLYSDRY